MTAATPGSAEPRPAERLVTEFEDIFGDITATERKWLVDGIARLAAKPAEEAREATIKECAIIAGSYATVSPRCAKLAAAAIRALSTTGAPKP